MRPHHGRIDQLATADEAAQKTDPKKHLRKICELNVSISSDRAQAIEFPKRQVAHSILQWEALSFTAEEYSKMGVAREQVLKLKDAFASGATVEQASALVTEHIIKTYYAAGKPEEVRIRSSNWLARREGSATIKSPLQNSARIRSKPLDYLRIRSPPH